MSSGEGMMGGMDDLVQFLRDRYDEETERAQLALRQDDPENGWGAFRPEGQHHTTIVPHVGMIHEPIQAEHVVRWNPARVLAEVDAKRQMLGVILRYEAKIDSEWGCCHSGDQIAAGQCEETNPNEIGALRLLALPYADHPKYRDEWRPETG
ncbi:DUF6221 family protein [Streptomyces sp. NPDC055254]